MSVLDTVVWPVVGRRHVGDQLGGGACGEASCARCAAREREKEGGGGSCAHGGLEGADGAVGDELVRRRRQKGSPAMAESGEVVAEAAGQASARGTACSKEWKAAELLDTVARRGDDGGRDYGGGAAAGASAKVRESEEEELGANGCVHRAARGGSRVTGSCVARAGAAVEHLPACLAKASSSLERLLGWAG